ncbi:MAG: hypothetical protein R6W86_11210 [Marinobacter sp.]|uniref:hypothetical protein n=1 Tax=Marinobacter sp. TaxID=50741 RepID=UPI00396D8DCB
MNACHLELFPLNDSQLTIQPHETVAEAQADGSKSMFDLCKDDGEVVGYVKTWVHDDGFAGFVHFDSDGNVVDWQVCSKPGIDASLN